MALWLGGIYFNEHQRLCSNLILIVNLASLDLEPLQSTTQEIGSSSRTSNRGQPQSPCVCFFPIAHSASSISAAKQQHTDGDFRSMNRGLVDEEKVNW